MPVVALDDPAEENQIGAPAVNPVRREVPNPHNLRIEILPPDQMAAWREEQHRLEFEEQQRHIAEHGPDMWPYHEGRQNPQGGQNN